MTSSPLAVKVEITPLTPGIIDSFAKPFLFQISGSIVLAHPLVLQRLISRKVQYILPSLSVKFCTNMRGARGHGRGKPCHYYTTEHLRRLVYSSGTPCGQYISLKAK